jgi:hypothetical protein
MSPDVERMIRHVSRGNIPENVKLDFLKNKAV